MTMVYVQGLKDKLELYALIIYIFYYILVVYELLLFSFADTSVLPHANDPQVCVIFSLLLSQFLCDIFNLGSVCD